MRLPPGLGAYSAPTPQLENVGLHTRPDHAAEKSFPRHCVHDLNAVSIDYKQIMTDFQSGVIEQQRKDASPLESSTYR